MNLAQQRHAPGPSPASSFAPRRGLLANAALAALLLAFFAAVLATASGAAAQARRAPKPSPTPDPAAAQLENVTAELGEINAELGMLHATLADLSGRLGRLEAEVTEIGSVVVPMREEVRGLYVETSNVRSEIARLEEKSIAEADALGRSRYVLTLLLVATAVLQLVVLAVLLRSR